MIDVYELLQMLDPASPKFRIPVVNENYSQSDAQKQKRERPQLLHKMHSVSPRASNCQNTVARDSTGFAMHTSSKLRAQFGMRSVRESSLVALAGIEPAFWP